MMLLPFAATLSRFWALTLLFAIKPFSLEQNYKNLYYYVSFNIHLSSGQPTFPPNNFQLTRNILCPKLNGSFQPLLFNYVNQISLFIRPKHKEKWKVIISLRMRSACCWFGNQNPTRPTTRVFILNEMIVISLKNLFFFCGDFLFILFSSSSLFNCSSVCFLCTLSSAASLSKFRDSKISRIQPAPMDTEINSNIKYLHADQQLDNNHAHKFNDGKKKSLSNHDIFK